MDNDKVDKFKGQAQDKFGEVKNKIGTAMDSDKVDKFKGQAQDKFGELKDKFTNKK
ncbi:CsbD family protein [Sporosarcina sp. resist]|nr:CsbD family protein [Sporosarcina sp. resist]